MSAVPAGSCHLLPMSTAQLDAVMAVETTAYAFPWSRGNFVDSLASGYLATVLYGDAGELLGYFVAMAGIDEMHLLNITVAPPFEGHGCARRMLDELVRLARARGALQLWLEVREGNARARSIYRRYGFVQVGLRKGYYPAAQGRRENAVVMSLSLGAPPAATNHALD